MWKYEVNFTSSWSTPLRVSITNATMNPLALKKINSHFIIYNYIYILYNIITYVYIIYKITPVSCIDVIAEFERRDPCA